MLNLLNRLKEGLTILFFSMCKKIYKLIQQGINYAWYAMLKFKKFLYEAWIYFSRKIYKSFLFCAFFIVCTILLCYEMDILDDILVIIRQMLHYFKIDMFLSFLYKLLSVFHLSILNSLLNKIVNCNEVKNLIQIFHNGIEVIKNQNIRSLIIVTLTSSVFAEIIHKYITDSTIKIFDVNPKPFYKYYSNNMRFKATICLIIIASIYKAHLTLVFILVAFIFYCFNIFFIHDYTRKIKEGIKQGYFDYIKYKKKNRKFFIGNKKRSLYDSSETLLEGLIIYSIHTHRKKEIFENYSSIQFNVEIFKEFYNSYLDDATIGIFLKQIKKSIHAFFYYEKDNENIFKNYFTLVLNTVFEDQKKNYEFYDTNIIVGMLFIISEIVNEDDSRKSYLNMLKENVSIKLHECYDKALISVYIIIFWRYSLHKNIDTDHFLIMLFSGIKNINEFTDDDVYEIYIICKNVLINIFDYSEKFIDMFNESFPIIINYIGDDFYNLYFKFEEEVR